jgi:hypothetical protein
MAITELSDEKSSALANSIFKSEEIMEEQIKAKNNVRHRILTNGRERKVVRLTQEQKDETRKSFKLFVELMRSVEAKLALKDSTYYYLFDEYAPFLYSRNALRDVARSLIACFNCGEIISKDKKNEIFMTKKDGYKTPLHICEILDEETNAFILGDTERTNWLNIYTLMLENNVFKHIMEILAVKYIGDKQ